MLSTSAWTLFGLTFQIQGNPGNLAFSGKTYLNLYRPRSLPRARWVSYGTRSYCPVSLQVKLLPSIITTCKLFFWQSLKRGNMENEAFVILCYTPRSVDHVLITSFKVSICIMIRCVSLIHRIHTTDQKSSKTIKINFNGHWSVNCFPFSSVMKWVWIAPRLSSWVQLPVITLSLLSIRVGNSISYNSCLRRHPGQRCGIRENKQLH